MQHDNCFTGFLHKYGNVAYGISFYSFPGLEKYGKWKIIYGKIFMFPDYYCISVFPDRELPAWSVILDQTWALCGPGAKCSPLAGSDRPVTGYLEIRK